MNRVLATLESVLRNMPAVPPKGKTRQRLERGLDLTPATHALWLYAASSAADARQITQPEKDALAGLLGASSEEFNAAPLEHRIAAYKTIEGILIGQQPGG